MKLLLVYAPFCTPATAPYSITNIYSFLRKNQPEGLSIDVLDLNLLLHSKLFGKYGAYFKSLSKKYDPEEYSRITREYLNVSSKVYSESNKRVVKGGNPELFDELMDKILSCSPDVVAFSVVYSSQAFHTLSFLKALKKQGIRTVVGGPAVSKRLVEFADACLDNETALLEYITGMESDKVSLDYDVDFSVYDLDAYFSPMPVIPVKTSSTCYYQQCTFCTHHRKVPYRELPIAKFKDKSKSYFLIDDMITKKRLLEIANSMGASWTCQLRPTKDLDYDLFVKLQKSGLKSIMWGVESGSDRILSLIKKGTNIKDINRVLEDSHRAGIKNIVYIIFGFPSETKDEFMETIDFLKNNSSVIDLVSTSVFGLQEGTYVCSHPEEFGITSVKKEERTVLDPKITYTSNKGLSQEQANDLRASFKKTLLNINKFPKEMNFFREHMLCLN